MTSCLPTIQGTIARRLLLNYRVEPEVLQRLLPAPLRPKLVRGRGMAGLCLVRLEGIRPSGLPPIVGFSSENAAHRVAVEWWQDGERREGVYIARRDSASCVNRLLGGRLFPAVQHGASFRTAEGGERYEVAMRSDDGRVRLAVRARLAAVLPAGSVFVSLAETSAFFEDGAVGYSPGRRTGTLDALELRTPAWRVEPLEVLSVESSFFDDATLFPPGSIAFDCGLIMRRVAHEWHVREPLRVGSAA